MVCCREAGCWHWHWWADGRRRGTALKKDALQHPCNDPAIKAAFKGISVHFGGIRHLPIRAQKTPQTVDLQGVKVVHPEELESPTF